MARTFDIILVEDEIGKTLYRISNRDKRHVDLLYRNIWVRSIVNWRMLYDAKNGLYNNVRRQLVAKNVRFKHV